jgi:hypothetical protein
MALYNTALAKLENMIVLPQGGMTRRPGFQKLGNAAVTSGTDCPVRLIPFIYNREDAMIIELYNQGGRIWRPNPAGVVKTFSAPYAASDLRDIKFVQTGNIIYFTHRNYPIHTLKRISLTEWEFDEFEFKNGPWLPDSFLGNKNIKLWVDINYPNNIYRINASSEFFTNDMVGTLIRLNYTIPSQDIEGLVYQYEGEVTTDPVEVGAGWSLRTTGSWRGTITLEKSLDNGDSWIHILPTPYHRTNTDDEGQLSMSGAETEANVIYRIRAEGESNTPIHYVFTVGGFTKTNIFRITRIIGYTGTIALGEWIKDENEVNSQPIFRTSDDATADWQLGAWGELSGYPAAVEFYQERLAFASSKDQIQTIWMSRIDDYANFGISDPIRDDDAITITLSADDNDGIHSLLAMSELLAFTSSSEWRVRGAGDNGAIAPNAVVAHRQDTIGSASFQPLVVHGQPVLVQTHRTEAHVLTYAMEMDGYAGSNLSIMSQHLFRWKEQESGAAADRRIVAFAYQQIPDSLIWFILADGTAATCTYMAEHAVIAWARQTTNGNVIGDVACIPGDGYTETWFAVRRGSLWGIERLAPRENEMVFTDNGATYESGFETLRLNLESQGGSMMSAKKLIPRLAVFVVRSKQAYAAPSGARDRQRTIGWTYGAGMTESEIMLDAGFENAAAVQVWVSDNSPLTVLAISPMLSAGK